MIHWLFSPRVYFWKIRIFWRAFSWHVQLLLAGGELLLAGAKLHNNRILSEEKTQDQPKCNCRQKDTCPLEGHCLDQELIYRCILKENTTSEEVNYNVLQKIHLKTNFISIAIPSSTKVWQIPQNYLNISGKWKEKAWKNQSCIGQLLIMLNHIRTGLKEFK